MAALTGQQAAASSKVEISSNGTVWTDISNAVITLEYSGGERTTSETRTVDGSLYVMTGNQELAEVAMSILYTEGATEAFETLRAAEAANGAAYIRWSPGGATPGDFQFTGTNGRWATVGLPGHDANSGDPIMVPVTWRGPKPSKAAVA